MSGLVPNRFLFHFRLLLPFRDPAPEVTVPLDDLGDDLRLPRLDSIDGLKSFAALWSCWSEQGVYLAARVSGRGPGSLTCHPDQYWKSDCLRICINTRPAPDIRRGTRYCSQFYCMPCGHPQDPKRPVAGVAPVQRARETPPPVDASRIQVHSTLGGAGYDLAVWFPAEVLHGYAPQEHASLGYYVMVEDLKLGQQFLTVGDELHWFVDPSTWATADLRR